MGTIDELTIYKDDRSRKIDLTTFCWHNDLIEWHKFYQENISDGYKNVDNIGWLKWWSKGWELAFRNISYVKRLKQNAGIWKEKNC